MFYKHGRFFIATILTERNVPMQNDENTFTKKIGQRTYKVKIFFSKTSKESFKDKILRLIKNDIANEEKRT